MKRFCLFVVFSLLFGFSTITAASNHDNPGTTQPVGTKLPNELGLHDMSGNGQEWLWDIKGDAFATYPNGLLVDYRGLVHADDPLRPSQRALRGGSYRTSGIIGSYTNMLALAFRNSAPDNYPMAYTFGFRIVRTF